MDMTNEMGNNNTADVKEEDKAADEQVKTGENVDQEAQTNDFHSTGAAFSSADILAAENSVGEFNKSIAEGELKNEPEPELDSMVSESSSILRDPASPNAHIAILASFDEAMKEKLVDLNLEESMPLSCSSQLDDQLCTPEEVDKGQERSEPPEPETRVQLPENENQLKENAEDSMEEQSRPLDERILEMNICEEKWSTENQLGNGPQNQGNPEGQDKPVINNEGTGFFASNELENKVEKGDLKQEDSSNKMEKDHLMINSLMSSSSQPDETCCKETGEKSNAQLSCSSSDTIIMHHNKSKSFLPDKIIEKYDDIEEVSLISPAITSFVTELSPTAETAEKQEVTCFNSEIENAFRSSPNAAKNMSSYEIFSPAFESSTSILLDKELAMIDQATSGAMHKTENPSTRSHEQYVIGRTSKGEAEELDARLEVKPNTLRKSPSFDFGVPIILRSEYSDQTPLLHHDNNASRSSFSGYSNIRGQNNTMQGDYFRKSLDFEPLVVEEKTIRMERSDSDVSRVSSLMKRDENVNVEHVKQKQESHVADQKAIEIKAEELALSNQKRRGKRKPGTSIFSTCVCCIAEFD